MKWIATYQPSHDIEHLALYVDRLHSMVNSEGHDSTGRLISERIGAALRGIAARNKLADINTERSSFAGEIQDLLCKDLLMTYGVTVKFNIDSVDSTVLETNSQQLEAQAKSTTDIRVETSLQVRSPSTRIPCFVFVHPSLLKSINHNGKNI